MTLARLAAPQAGLAPARSSPPTSAGSRRSTRLVNAVVTRTFDAGAGQAAARRRGAGRAGQPLGLLHGLPVAHKDLAETAGVRTTYGSPLFAEHVPDRDALVVSRMAAGRGDQPGQDQHAGVRGGLAHGQPGVRRHPQPLRPEPQRGRQQRRRGGGAGGADDLPGRRQRPGRLAAQPGELLQRRRAAARRPAGCPPGRSSDVADQLGVDGPMARTVADVALLLAVLAGPDPRVPLALDAPPPALAEPGRGPGPAGAGPARACGSPGAPDLGLPVEPGGAGRCWRRPGRCSPSSAARSPTRRRTCPAPTRCSAPGGRSGSRPPSARCCAEHPGQLGPNVAWNVRARAGADRRPT